MNCCMCLFFFHLIYKIRFLSKNQIFIIKCAPDVSILTIPVCRFLATGVTWWIAFIAVQVHGAARLTLCEPYYLLIRWNILPSGINTNTSFNIAPPPFKDNCQSSLEKDIYEKCVPTYNYRHTGLWGQTTARATHIINKTQFLLLKSQILCCKRIAVCVLKKNSCSFLTLYI